MDDGMKAVAALTGDKVPSELKKVVLGGGEIAGGEAASTGGGKVGGELAIGESLHSRRGSLTTIQSPFLPAFRVH